MVAAGARRLVTVGVIRGEAGPGWQLSTILAAARQVTPAVTPALPGQAAAVGRITECQNSPYRGGGDTQSPTP